MAQKKESEKEKMTLKEAAFLLVPPGVVFVFTFILFQIYYPPLNLVVTLGLISAYVTWAIVGVLTVFFLPLLLSIHYWLRLRFKESIETGVKASKSRMLVSVLLNLAYWTMIWFLPLSDVFAVIPFARILEGTLPLVSLSELITQFPFSVLVVLFSGSGGPGTIYLISIFSPEDRKKGTSARALTILQGVCYLSWLLLLLTLAGLKFGYGQLDIFLTFLMFLILPSTFVNNAAIRFLEIRRTSIRKRTNVLSGTR